MPKKRYVEKDVYTLALERACYLYENFDNVLVGFSGGKDSTAALNVTVEAARKYGRTPVDVLFFDEEAIYTQTVEYVRRMRDNPDINVKWFCVPVKHRNACSNSEPWWYPWAKEAESLWVRSMPEYALTESDIYGFERDSIPNVITKYIEQTYEGATAEVVGLRADESIMRHRAVCNRLDLNWLATSQTKYAIAKPVYDWAVEDVWLAVTKFGWDYNTAYDAMHMAGIPPRVQRVAPPFGEEPLRALWTFSECNSDTDLWERMINRVSGAHTAGMYSQSPLYGFNARMQKPDNLSWPQYVQALLAAWPVEEKVEIAHRIRSLILYHKKRCGSATIPKETPHPVSGISYAFLATIAKRGDIKGRRTLADQCFKQTLEERVEAIKDYACQQTEKNNKPSSDDLRNYIR